MLHIHTCKYKGYMHTWFTIMWYRIFSLKFFFTFFWNIPAPKREYIFHVHISKTISQSLLPLPALSLWEIIFKADNIYPLLSACHQHIPLYVWNLHNPMKHKLASVYPRTELRFSISHVWLSCLVSKTDHKVKWDLSIRRNTHWNWSWCTWIITQTHWDLGSSLKYSSYWYKI